MNYSKYSDNYYLYKRLRKARNEALTLAHCHDVATNMGDHALAERYEKRYDAKLRECEILSKRVWYRRCWRVSLRLRGADKGGCGARYTRGPTVHKKGWGSWTKPPKRRRVNARFRTWLWDKGVMEPYGGIYEIWAKRIPRWLAKRRGIEGRTVYKIFE